jgi:hypothetical protein
MRRQLQQATAAAAGATSACTAEAPGAADDAPSAAYPAARSRAAAGQAVGEGEAGGCGSKKRASAEGPGCAIPVVACTGEEAWQAGGEEVVASSRDHTDGAAERAAGQREASEDQPRTGGGWPQSRPAPGASGAHAAPAPGAEDGRERAVAAGDQGGDGDAGLQRRVAEARRKAEAAAATAALAEAAACAAAECAAQLQSAAQAAEAAEVAASAAAAEASRRAALAFGVEIGRGEAGALGALPYSEAFAQLKDQSNAAFKNGEPVGLLSHSTACMLPAASPTAPSRYASATRQATVAGPRFEASPSAPRACPSAITLLQETWRHRSGCLAGASSSTPAALRCGATAPWHT